MKQLAIRAAVVAGIILCVSAQAKDFSKSGPVIETREVTWPVPWQPGRRLEYDHATETVDIRDGRESRSASTSIATIEIIHADADGFLQRWTWRDGRVEHEDEDEAVRRATEAMLRGLEGLPLDVRLDSDGAYAAVENIGQLAGKAREAMHRVARETWSAPGTKRRLSAKERAGLLRMLDMLTTPEAFENVIAPVPSRFNFVAGGGLTPGRLYEYDDEGANPFGGTPFPMHSTMLVEADEQPGWYLFHWTMAMDREKGGEVFADAVGTLMEGSRLKMPKAEVDDAREAIMRDTDFSFSARYRVDARTGVVQWMQLVQAKRVGGRNSVQTSTLTLRK